MKKEVICRIRLLKSTFGNDSGDIIDILHKENVNNLYYNLFYNDGFGRWCYISSEDENINFEYVKE